MASAVCDSVESINPKDIIGTQYIMDTSLWVITLSTKQAKAKLLANNIITIKDRQYPIQDYSAEHGIRKKRGIRLSIHDLPQSLPNEYIEQWVDSFAKRESPVTRHREEDRRRRGGDTFLSDRFRHLYTGHRFCYVSEIYTHKPRFSEILIPDPRYDDKLIDAQVVLYYDGQSPPNCARCHLDDHQARECPDKPQFKCFLCNQVGHSKQQCPTAELGPTCFRCNKRGHTKRFCLENKAPIAAKEIQDKPKQDKPKQMRPQVPVPSQKPAETQSKARAETRAAATSNPKQDEPQAQAINILHELINKCTNPAEGPTSPDVLKKVEDLLTTANMAKAKDMEKKKNKTITKKAKKVKRKNSTSPGVTIPSKKNRQTSVTEYVVPLAYFKREFVYIVYIMKLFSVLHNCMIFFLN